VNGVEAGVVAACIEGGTGGDEAAEEVEPRMGEEAVPLTAVIDIVIEVPLVDPINEGEGLDAAAVVPEASPVPVPGAGMTFQIGFGSVILAVRTSVPSPGRKVVMVTARVELWL
jgi:hypothetical protein